MQQWLPAAVMHSPQKHSSSPSTAFHPCAPRPAHEGSLLHLLCPFIPLASNAMKVRSTLLVCLVLFASVTGGQAQPNRGDQRVV